MNKLLLEAMLPLYAPMVNNLAAANPMYWPAIMAFVLLASVTVMNMLIGVLVEVVRTVAATEKEGMTVAHVSHSLKEVMHAFHNGGGADSQNPAFGGRMSMRKRHSNSGSSGEGEVSGLMQR